LTFDFFYDKLTKVASISVLDKKAD